MYSTHRRCTSVATATIAATLLALALLPAHAQRTPPAAAQAQLVPARQAEDPRYAPDRKTAASRQALARDHRQAALGYRRRDDLCERRQRRRRRGGDARRGLHDVGHASCGGETQALIYNPHTKKVIGINALGVAPTGATAAVSTRRKGYKFRRNTARSRRSRRARGRAADDAGRVRQAVARGGAGAGDPDGRRLRDRGAAHNTIERNKSGSSSGNTRRRSC